MLDINELKQKRAKIVTEMREINDGCVERGVETAEEKQKFETYETDIRRLEHAIEREELLQEQEKKAALSARESEKQLENRADKWDGVMYAHPGAGEVSAAEMERRKALYLQGWLMDKTITGRTKIRDEHHRAAKFFRGNVNDTEICIPISKDYRAVKQAFFQEQRDMSLTAAAGGYTVAQDFSGALEKTMLAFGGMRAVSTIKRTSTGADMPWPTMTDVANKGAILNEATSIGSSVDPTFGVVLFKAFKYHSKPVLLSNEIIEDSAFDLSAEIGTAVGERIARIQNDHFTTGAGTTLPKGVVVSAGLGKTATATNAIVADELIDLLHSLDPAYRANARFMMSDPVLAALRKLKFSIGSDQIGYVWQGSFQQGVPDRILGFPYTINQSMSSTFATAEKLVLFGDFSKYIIRDVADVRLVVLRERYADLDQIAYDAFLRSDGQLLDAGTDPIKYLRLA